MGATVVDGQDLPRGWAGKAWALQQGLEAAIGDWVVTLDADTRPDPRLPAALVARARADAIDLVTVAGRFDCPTPGLRWLHPAMLTTLVYRGAPPGATAAGPVHRRMANGQCMAFARAMLVGAGGFAPIAGHTVEDVALARGLAVAGFAVDFLDASSMLRVRMYESLAGAWSGWGRSLSLPGVDPWLRRAADLVVVAVAQAAPLPRLVARRGDLLDVVLLVARVGTLFGTARAYDRRGPAYWLSPLADPIAVVAIARGLVTRRQRWRGRTYPAGPQRRPLARAKRRPMNVISAPVAAVRRGPSRRIWTSGKAMNPARTPGATDPRRTAAAAPTVTATAAVGGDMTAAAPPKVATARPPRKRANRGQACPTIAAPPPTTGGHHSSGSATARPMAAAAMPLAMSPTRTGRAARRPSDWRAFHHPGLWSPTDRRST